MPLEEQDATIEETSTSTETTPDVVEEVQEVPSASNDAPAEENVAAEEVPKEFDAKVDKALGKKPEETEKADEESKDEQDKSKAESDALSQEEEKVPENLTQRAEWQSLTKIADKVGKAEGKEARRILRQFYKEQHDQKQTIEKLRPAQDVVQEMVQACQGDKQGFDNMRSLIRSFDNEPDKAVPMLQMLLDDAMKRAGLVIHSDDLKRKVQEIDQKVQDQQLTPEEAQARKQELIELEQSRATTKRVQTRSQAEQQRIEKQTAEQKAKEQLEQLAQVESTWTAEKTKSDADYPVVKNLHDVFVRNMTNDFVAKNQRWPDAKESTQILDDALKAAKQEAGKFRPKPQERKVIQTNGNGSSTNTRPEPKTAYERFEARVEQAQSRNRR